MGNICRSPTAEGVMRHYVAERGLADRVEIDSAGTIDYHEGSLPDPRSRQAAAARGYRLDSCARQVTAADLARFDLIVAMDRDNLEYLDRLDRDGRHEAKLRLLSSFLPPGGPEDVPDPYYGGAKGFDRVLDMIEAACPAILTHLLGTEG
jgi:protein-tyrosine phosphatase